jgi:hypothetical protein
VTGEENGQCRSRPQSGLHARHDGAAQRTNESIVVGLLGKAARDGKGEHAFRMPNQSHQDEIYMAAVHD